MNYARSIPTLAVLGALGAVTLTGAEADAQNRRGRLPWTSILAGHGPFGLPIGQRGEEINEDEDEDEDEDCEGDREGSSRNDSDDAVEDEDESDDRGATGGAAADTSGATGATGRVGRTWGIFVGVSDYGGDNESLPGSAADAVQLARAFQQAGWMQRSNAVVLTDRQATLANVRQAFRTIAPQVRPEDTFVFFFDGHGNTRTLDLVGSDLSQSALGAMMDTVHGRQLVVLDSCNAGGFAPLARAGQNRAGLFSSRASESSSTAPEVNAGGWLAYFFREAVAGAVRRNPDGGLDFDQVVRFVEARYQQRNVSPRQNLVAVRASRGEAFAIGGRPGAVAPADVAVARRQTERPTERPTDTLFGSNDGFAQALGFGGRVAGQVLSRLVK